MTGRTGAPSARRLRGYLTDAVEEIRGTALFSSTVDWDGVDRDAQAVLGAATCYADTHAFLDALLKQAGGHHSFLIPPGPAGPRRPGAPMPAGPATPSGELIGTGLTVVAYLRLPTLPGGREATRGYLADGAAAMGGLLAARPCGWIVNLRANLGGGIWPMLAVVAPLLPDGVLGHFLVPDGRVQVWSAHRGRIRLDRRTMARSRTPRPPEEHTPVAVLTSRRTASAGEAVALAFRAQPRARLIGTPTAGFTTGNRTHLLRDGTRLLISGVRYADQQRNPVEGPVPVDELLTDNSRDAALDAALAWIHGRGCAG
jgi:hypothetical protein